MNHLVIAFLIGLLSAAILALPIFKGLIALKSRQTVSQYVAEHAHKQGTPTMGGLIILAGGLPAMGYWAYVAGFSKVLPVLILAVGYALIGFVDDFVLPRVKKGSRGFGWIPKLGLQVAIAGLAVWLGEPYKVIPAIIAVFFILFFSNAYNFTDGLDWLAGTVFVAFALGLGVTAYVLEREYWLFPLVGLLGAIIPFLVLNRPPARIFMGDVGSMPIGGVLGLAVTAIMMPASNLVSYPVEGPKADFELAVFGLMALLSIVMIVELVPVPLQILSVKLRKKRLFPMTPIHHAFQKAGWPETRIVGLFFGVQLAASMIVGLLIWQMYR
jgi:phospho-N-acetylmuramoyl-pentapeptide-transferase